MNKTWGIIIFVAVAVTVIAMVSRNGTDEPMIINDQIENSLEVSENVNAGEEDVMNGESKDGGMYQVYSPTNLTSAQQAGKRVILFFHASWCPTCKQADSDITANLANLPDDVVVLKTDYDSYSELKEKYGITYQHTFVEIDSEGNQLQKWNGGGVSEINSRLN